MPLSRPARVISARRSALGHTIAGAFVGIVAVYVTLISAWIIAIDASAWQLVFVVLGPWLLFWALDALMNSDRGHLRRGMLAGTVVIAVVVALVDTSVVMNFANPGLAVVGAVAGALAVLLTRIADISGRTDRAAQATSEA